MRRRLAAALFVPAALALATASAWPKRAFKRPLKLAPPAVSVAPAAAGIVTLKAPEAREVLIRAGTFTMGSSLAEVEHARFQCLAEPRGCPLRILEELMDETAAHRVTLSDFFFDRHEVTVERYRRCVDAGECSAPPYHAGAERFDKPGLPVVLVTWMDADRFCKWDGRRLPTEAEWERAARGLTGRRYPWGNVYNPFLCNHGRAATIELDAGDGFAELAPVGSFADGKTPDGIHDLAGNAEEWVADYYAKDYAPSSAWNPTGPAQGDFRVVRGGHYRSGRPFLRAADRHYRLPGSRTTFTGFRCARTAGPDVSPPSLFERNVARPVKKTP